MSTPKISVIVPVYKVEKYLHRCIDSILAQTFTDFELLLINDGSPDNCGAICNEYALKDSRIRVFHKENGGVSSARNLGLDNVIGEWIVFIDSDDTVDNDYLENLYTPIIHSSNSILVFANYVTNQQVLKPIINGEYEKSDMVRVFIEQGLMRFSAPYSKLFNTSIVKGKGIYFPSGVHMGEDAIFVLNYLNLVDKIIILNKCNYLVNRREGSLITKYNSFESEWKGYFTWKKEFLSFITKYGPIYEDPVNVVWENSIGNSFVRCLQCIYRTNESMPFAKQISILRNIPQADYDEYKKHFKTSLIRRKFNKFLIINKFYSIYCFLGLVERCVKKISL